MSQDWGKYLQIINLLKGLYPKYVKDFQNAIKTRDPKTFIRFSKESHPLQNVNNRWFMCLAWRIQRLTRCQTQNRELKILPKLLVLKACLATHLQSYIERNPPKMTMTHRVQDPSRAGVFIPAKPLRGRVLDGSILHLGAFFLLHKVAPDT